VSSSIIYNGVDLNLFKPSVEIQTKKDCLRVLLVEGSLLGGYEYGLEIAIKFVVEFAGLLGIAHSHLRVREIELVVVGKVPSEVQSHWATWLRDQVSSLPVRVSWLGSIPHTSIPEIDRSAHLFYSSDLNAACPNSVIEALASGTPILAFDTGALREIVTGNSGMIVSYGGDPWKLDPPDIPALAKAAVVLVEDLEKYRIGARSRAEEAFDVNEMVDRYLDVLSVVE
jgi:glycosyltransferase involved in cell wall biosynthesis